MACLDGQGGFNWEGLRALKTHVSLREALEIEAVKCVAGDTRHEYQNFYSTYLAEQRAASKDVSKLGQLDPARLLEEIDMTRQAISEHEAMLAEHRAAVVAKQPSQLSDADVDATHATLDSLRANLPVIEAEYAKLMEKTQLDRPRQPAALRGGEGR